MFDILQLGREDSVADHARRSGLIIIIILVNEADLGEDLRAVLGKVFRGVISSVTDATSPRRGHSFLHHRTSLVVVTLLFLRRTVLQFALYFVLTHCFVMRVWLLTMWTFVSLHSSVEIFVVKFFFLFFFIFLKFFFLDAGASLGLSF